MHNNFDFALQLLGIGMVTVFTILLLVVLIGTSIIHFVNKFLPVRDFGINTPITKESKKISTNKMAAIVAAVQLVTHGKGRVVKVEKES